jgi:hypothetical protein
MLFKTIVGGAVLVVAVAVGLGVYTFGLKPVSAPLGDNTATTTAMWACNADAMLCPDGSSLGRTGPSCQFPACPPPDAIFAKAETYLGGRDGGLGITINPREVVSDSRCPKDVQCVWAGTVEVRAAVESKVGHGEHIFTLGEPRMVGNVEVTLVEVRPSSAKEAQNPETGYWFVFELKKR